ncbi:HAD family hydrolase [Teichococcus oryzae]|uniref:Haloacid dehalogenase-like hydrolase n=1 Tax=Teichococcus oryzae TaxID=1608942 RepID=A0A5B2THY5_9PROT|nr:HAD family hydrolase [Pseudoroseomonas oryzae]KAA2213714.1 haloacid dehalogenase-like hydrolase [Pseudoroseomonas oryzae]
MPENRDNLARCDLDDALHQRAADDNGAVFVDFDHTIFSCNSTELFIASCKPSLLVAIIDFLVRQCIPWRLTGLPRWFRLRDYACVLLIVLLMPWNLWLWKRRAPALFARHESLPVRRSLSRLDPQRMVIVTFGLDFVVRGLLRGSHWERTRLVATPMLPRPGHFARGKLDLLGELFGREAVAASTSISDSLDDRDLLAASRNGILIEPQGAEFRAAEHLYIPLRYTARAKYTTSYLVDQIFLVDIALLMLATAQSGLQVAEALLYIPLLVLSAMCVYEMGYFENDMVAARRELKPTLTAEVKRFIAYPIYPGAWIWAIALGMAGMGVAYWRGELDVHSVPAAIGFWIGALIVLRAVFFAYNQRRTDARLVMYPMLHFMKYCPIFVLVHPTPMGVVLALSQVATMWVVYMTYRLGGNQKAIPKEVFRTGLWAIGMGFLGTAGLFGSRENMVILALMGTWCAARISKPMLLQWARRNDLRSALKSALSP